MFNTIKVNNTDTNYTHSIFDISEYTGKKYDTLSDALTDVPDGKQSGGMTVRFVSTSENKYVQYRLTKNIWSIDTADWEKAPSLKDMGDLLQESANIIGDIIESSLTITGTSIISTQKLLKSGIKYLIYAKCDTANSAGNNSGAYVSPHITNGSNSEQIKIINKALYNSGVYFEYTPVSNLYLYFRTQSASDVINYKISVLSVENSLKDLSQIVNTKLSNVDKDPAFNSLNFVESGGIYGFVNGYEKTEKDFTDLGINKHINLDGSISSTGSSQSVWTIKVTDDLTKITIKGSCPGGLLAIAFYSGDTPSASSLMSGSVEGVDSVVREYSANIPSGCKCIGTTTYFTPSSNKILIESSKTSKIQGQIADLTENLDEISVAVDNNKADFDNFVVSEDSAINKMLEKLIEKTVSINSTSVVPVSQDANAKLYRGYTYRIYAKCPTANDGSHDGGNLGLYVYNPSTSNYDEIKHLPADEFAKGTYVIYKATFDTILYVRTGTVGDSVDVILYQFKLYDDENTKNIIDFLDFDKFTEHFNYSAGPWSDFISLEGVDKIICRLHSVNNINLIFYKNEKSHYSSDYLMGDIRFRPVSELTDGIIQVPPTYKYVSFRVNGSYYKEDFVGFIRKVKGFDYQKNQRLLDKAKCISDSWLNSCGEPCLLYDDQRGIVYENYVCGNGNYSEQNRWFGFAKFPITQPERAEYSIPFKWGETLIDGKVIRFRDPQSYFLNENTIRLVAPGSYDRIEGVYLIDQNLDGTIKGTCIESHWADNVETITYDTYISHLVAAGFTPHTPPSTDYMSVLVSSSHVQEYNGYKYTTMNVGYDCPMIIRTNDDFETIEIVKIFDFICSFETALIIDGTNWYIMMRGNADGHSGSFYSCSSDGGVTWSEITWVTQSGGWKPRGIMYDGKPLFLVPMNYIPGIGTIQQNFVSDGRTCVKFIRGDINTPINEWKEEVVLVSKYGQNYGDIILVGKDLYYAWSCDMVHSYTHTGQNYGKAEIMFTRIGDLDGDSIFIGDV